MPRSTDIVLPYSALFRAGCDERGRRCRRWCRAECDASDVIRPARQRRAPIRSSPCRDPSVRAIVTTRGGAGAYRIADLLDFDAVRADPKPLVGFSDITHLQLAPWPHCRVPSVHGALAGPRSEEHTSELQYLIRKSYAVSC